MQYKIALVVGVHKGIGSVETFHIKGPVPVDNSSYAIRVAIVANSNLNLLYILVSSRC